MTTELLNRIYNGSRKIRKNIEIVDDTHIQLFLEIRGERTCVLEVCFFEGDNSWVDIQPRVSFPKGAFVRSLLFPFQGISRLLSLLSNSPEFPQKLNLLKLLQECHDLSEGREADQQQFFPTPEDYLRVVRTLDQILSLVKEE
ncbi:MAG: hypothetical protein ACFFDT_17375 [Candidatus Hodarchaeota archaeon]